MGAQATCRTLRDEVDDLACPQCPERFQAVGLWYLDFSQTTDEEVRDLLARAAEDREAAGPTGGIRLSSL
ncbi:hypothetical protein VT85_21750 [Planctomyces sp. SH-PL62]|nr:hypothetical protein [Planctomyces sp. SH-PL62]AMV40074.1 hypothetical protein VT85_21750 [Planctomyces sp. SH-PL62]